MMGFFSTLFAANKYSSHPEILDKIAREVADLALRQIKEYRNDTSSLTLHCKMYFGYGISLDSREYQHYVGGRCASGYTIRFSDYGMESIPEKDEKVFLETLLPYVRKHLDNNVEKYFSSGSSVHAFLTSFTEENNWTDDRVIPIIKVSVSSFYSKTIENKPTLKKW